MILTETKDYKIVKDILTDPILFKLTSGISEQDPNTLVIDTTYTYILAKQDNEIIGCFKIKEFTKLVLEAHIDILPKYWGNGISAEVANAGFKYAVAKGYNKLITTVPASCEYVVKFCDKLGWKCCGMIKEGIVYNNILSDLFFYEFDLARFK